MTSATQSRDGDAPALVDDFEGWVEAHGGRVIPLEDPLAIMPSEYFDEETLPSVDPMPATIEADGERRLPVPLVWAKAECHGVTLLAREHVAFMWVTATETELIEEFKLRRQFDLPIPPVVERAVTSAAGDSNE